MSLPEGRRARGPQAVSQRDSGNQTDEGEYRLSPVEPLALSLGFLARQCAGGEQQQGEVDRKGVVLLVGGEGEKDQDDRCVDGKQPGGSDPEKRGARSHKVPSASGGPRPPENYRQVDAPGKEPDQMQAPVENKGKLVVVDWITFAQEAKHLFVNEVEIEEAVDVARGGDVACGVTGAWVAQPGEYVPWRCDGKEEQNA